MTSAPQARRRQRAKAARQALALCEAEQHTRNSAATARTALRAAGLPPHLAAALRGRIRLIPEQEPRP